MPSRRRPKNPYSGIGTFRRLTCLGGVCGFNFGGQSFSDHWTYPSLWENFAVFISLFSYTVYTIQRKYKLYG